jgi:hypothetical protein
MTRKTARAGVVAMVMAGTAIMGSGLPAQAKTNTEPVGVQDITWFYSNAQHTTTIGEVITGEAGCPSSRWGTTSIYVVTKIVKGC